MPHTYVSDLVHCVFSTKQRKKNDPGSDSSGAGRRWRRAILDCAGEQAGSRSDRVMVAVDFSPRSRRLMIRLA